MIGRLTGHVVEISPGSVVLDVGGVGYALQIPLSTFEALAGRHAAGVSLHVHTHVREDSLQLFGFATRDERWAFEHLIGISGVGPKTALAVLSGIGARDLERAVSDGDREMLQRIPGIGRKTAERILLELKDRLGPEAPAGRGKGGAGEAAAEGRVSLRADAVSALVNLGYSRDAAARAVDAAIDGEGASGSLAAVLKGALRGLMR